MNKKLLSLALIAFFIGTSSFAQTEETSSEEKKVETSGGKVKLTRKRRRLRRSRIQELERYHKKRKGQDIFGVGLLGFTGGMAFGSLKGATNAGAPSDGFKGLGAGVVFDIQLAGGSTNSIGIKSSGAWYWRFGVRAHLDFVRRTDKESSEVKREVNEMLAGALLKYYFPMDDYSFSRRIIILNRAHFFVGVGPMWSVGINDTIERVSDRTFSKGPTQSDIFAAFEVGFNLRITQITYMTFDFRMGFNMTSEINDNLTGKQIEGTGGGGTMSTMHLGVAYAF